MAASAETFWHGSSRIVGDWVEAGDVVGTTRAAGDGVYVTTDRRLAETYAATADGPAWVYEVEPDGPVEPTPSLIGGPTISYRCARARIVRRYTMSNAQRRRILANLRRAAERMKLW
jgi:hypothetical protein